MKVETLRNGAHRAIVTTAHKGAWVKLKVSDGHTAVEITLKPSQAVTVCDNIMNEVMVAASLTKTSADHE